MICCIDTQIYIWGGKQECTSGQEEFRDRAIHLFNLLDVNKDHIMLPQIVVAESLAIEPLEKHAVILDKISKTCITSDFDARCALQYAHLFTNRMEELKKTAIEIGVDNERMKIDHLIIATAMVHGANCIYSHDKGIKTFGQRYIEVKELPLLPPPKFVQQSIFEIPQ